MTCRRDPGNEEDSTPPLRRAFSGGVHPAYTHLDAIVELEKPVPPPVAVSGHCVMDSIDPGSKCCQPARRAPSIPQPRWAPQPFPLLLNRAMFVGDRNTPQAARNPSSKANVCRTGLTDSCRAPDIAAMCAASGPAREAPHALPVQPQAWVRSPPVRAKASMFKALCGNHDLRQLKSYARRGIAGDEPANQVRCL